MLVRRLQLMLLAVLGTASQATAQHVHGVACEPTQNCYAATATGLLTSIAAQGGRRFSEAYLTQPMVAADVRAWGGRLQALGIYNLEGYTLRRGELSPGTYGEGYVDRRHPHSHVHEVMLGVQTWLAVARVSLFAGKGFVPFGSDDPMMRPFVRYPANHHLAQILERGVIVAAARVGPVALELASFGGDEPESPTDWPNSGRLFDSWSARTTVLGPLGIESSFGVARVRSPEFAAGFGLNQNKYAASLRYSGSPEARVSYAMVEWARTTEWLGVRKDLWFFASGLAEATVRTPVGHVSLRLERTSRPEEQRDRTPFRSVRPLLDFGILGRTRWESATVGWSRSQPTTGVQVTPFAEVSVNRARPLERVVIASPADAFGGLRLFSISAGVRLGLGAWRPRMGRYGAAA
ncbi:MAG: hypothetical protein ACT4P6_14505 [Gemmatimonadaceae bacterium]